MGCECARDGGAFADGAFEANKVCEHLDLNERVLSEKVETLFMFSVALLCVAFARATPFCAAQNLSLSLCFSDFGRRRDGRGLEDSQCRGLSV